jgi:hypothetical protein
MRRCCEWLDWRKNYRAVVVEDPVSAEERQALLALGQDLAGVWDNPATSAEVKKRIARMLVKEIVLFEEERGIKAMVHWQGGQHTELRVPRLSYGESASPTSTDTVETIRALARQMQDRFIARVLNRRKIPTAKGHTWNEARVRAIRCGYEITVYQAGERESRSELNILEAAKELKVEWCVIGELIKAGYLPASQVCAYAPWVIRRKDLNSAQVRAALRQGKLCAPCVQKIKNSSP